MVDVIKPPSAACGFRPLACHHAHWSQPRRLYAARPAGPCRVSAGTAEEAGPRRLQRLQGRNFRSSVTTTGLTRRVGHALVGGGSLGLRGGHRLLPLQGLVAVQPAAARSPPRAEPTVTLTGLRSMDRRRCSLLDHHRFLPLSAATTFLQRLGQMLRDGSPQPMPGWPRLGIRLPSSRAWGRMRASWLPRAAAPSRYPGGQIAPSTHATGFTPREPGGGALGDSYASVPVAQPSQRAPGSEGPQPPVRQMSGQ